jgi:hypothetical protein
VERSSRVFFSLASVRPDAAGRKAQIGAYRFVNEAAAALDVILLPPVCRCSSFRIIERLFLAIPIAREFVDECAVDCRIDENIDQPQLPRSDRVAEHCAQFADRSGAINADAEMNAAGVAGPRMDGKRAVAWRQRA